MNKTLSSTVIIIIAVAVVVWIASVVVTIPDIGLLFESISPSPEVRPSAIVNSAAHPDLGNYLTDGMGKTLYVYGKDESLKSSCNDECAQKWIPYTANPEGFKQSDDNLLKTINIIQRTDGSYQYAYGEKPLYYYYQDSQPGDIKGDGINELWSIVLLLSNS